jgi:hypothetical protein
MNRHVLALALAALVAALPAASATTTSSPRASGPTRARASALVAAGRAGGAARSGGAARTGNAARAGSAARTLDDIHIEGEIPVPQVLFITARDQRRFVGFQPQRYLRSSRQLAEATTSPRWIVVPSSPITPVQETQR